MNQTLKISYRKAGSATWHGALKDATGRFVWVCEHNHQNRDNGSDVAGRSARGCAEMERRRRFQCEAA